MRLPSLILSAAASAAAAALPCAAATPALTLERIFANPPLAGTAPRALTIAPDGRHIAWLKPRDADPLRFDLWVQTVDGGRERMAVDSLALSSAPKALSEAELQRRERARLSASLGIVDYQWAPDGKALLVPLDGDIWLAPLNARARRITSTKATETDAKMSPGGRHISFVRDQNVYVQEIPSGIAQALTTGGGGLVSYGVAEFVAQEEMKRSTGYWWAPDDRRIAVARVDESPVKVAVRAAIGSDATRMTEQRYPFAGTPNALVSLQIHSLAGAPPIEVDLGKDSDIYLARVHWLNADSLVVQRQSRDQRQLDLLLVDAATGASRTLFSETSDTWLNLHDSFKPLADGKSFLWASERSGHRHIWRWDGSRLTPITRGDWSVDELLGVDEASGHILFTGFAETPLEKALYRARLDGTGEPVRLSQPGGWADTVSDGTGRTALVTRSTPTQPAQIALVDTATGKQRFVRENPISATPYAAFAAGHQAYRFGTVKAADGSTDLHFRMLVPPGLKPGERAPVFLEVYGGPGVQRVQRAWGSLLHQYMLRRGYVVFQLDNRGTPNRGTAFEAPLYRKLGFPEVDDQMAGLAWLKAQPFVDPARVAVYGWSYGGYMVQRLMTEHPAAFAAGISGAPVTDWTLYDTHYTERYLGNPAQDMAPYTASDVTLKSAALLRPLRIIHGLADDNVVFDHSARMIAALQKAGKAFDTAIYPGQTHAIRDPALQLHLWEGNMAFLEQHLGVGR